MHQWRVALGSMAPVLILALLIPLVGCGGGGPTVPCKISFVTGNVQVSRSDSTESVKATEGMELAVGDTITTGSDGSANLTFFDGSLMEIKANSEILVKELSTASTGSTSVSLRQNIGRTINRVNKLIDSGSKYEVETRSASTVVKGTIFELLVLQNGDTTVKAEQDSVSFTASGVTVTVNQGFRSSASVGGTPSTPTSGQTLADIYSKSAYKGDVKFDMVVTSSKGQQPSGTPQMYKITYSVKGWASLDTWKWRAELPASLAGFTLIDIADYATGTEYNWYPDQNIACSGPFDQTTEDNIRQTFNIVLTYLGTETVDDKLCDKYQHTEQGTTTTTWIWKDKTFPIKAEAISNSGTTTLEYKNIVFAPLSDSLFTVPSSVTMQAYPCYPMPTSMSLLSPEGAVRGFFEAIEAKDAGKAASYVTDAVFGVMGPSIQGIFNFYDKIEIVNLNTKVISETESSATVEVQHDFRLTALGLTDIVQEKIAAELTKVGDNWLISRWPSQNIVQVTGHSMEPTIQDGATLIIDRSAYTNAGPNRADMIIFTYDGYQKMGRVIGLPGETITIQGGGVYVNGLLLDEQYLAPGTTTESSTSELKVPDDCYFVLGDNRANSLDSRSFGPVSQLEINAKVVL